jgi:hypothetical protein
MHGMDECSYRAMATKIHRFVPRLLSPLALAGVLALVACSGDGDGDGAGNESEVITTVTLTFTPQGGGTPVVASFTDPDGDGGVSGSADSIALVSGTSYALGVAFLDELQDPVQDITAEVEEEAEAHQLFVTGSAVEGPATAATPGAPVVHAYADMESRYGTNAVGDDLPVGLANTITARAAGMGTFAITLRHLPEINGQPQKVAGLAEALAAGDPLPGEVDAAVEFELLTVQ